MQEVIVRWLRLRRSMTVGWRRARRERNRLAVLCRAQYRRLRIIDVRWNLRYAHAVIGVRNGQGPFPFHIYNNDFTRNYLI